MERQTLHNIAVVVLALLVAVSLVGPSLALSTDSGTPTNKRAAVVVGGGPVGLATALTLSNPPHGYDVTILEQASMEQYDPTKAYVYNVNPRGQVWMQKFPAALEKLEMKGSSTSGTPGITLVPADPTVPISKPYKPVFVRKTDEASEKGVETEIKEPVDTSYWIPRHSMVGLFEEVIAEQEEKRIKGEMPDVGSIRICKGCQVLDVVALDEADDILAVTAKQLSNELESTYTGSLVVGADGFMSAVRCVLADNNKGTWLQSKSKHFKVKRWVSPSTGLRMKVLQLPPDMSIPNSDGSFLPTESEKAYLVSGINNGSRNFLRCGILPVKDKTMVRTMNVITRPCHDIWSLNDGPSMKRWYESNFPRFDWDQYVDNAEWDRFAKAEGTTFPPCQYSPGLQVSSADGQCGIVLVGDAAHAFPPDIGQGINAGLGDVVALDRALLGKDVVTGKEKSTTVPPANLGEALHQYEQHHGKQVKALIRLARFGFPYQYRQPLLKDRIGRFFAVLNLGGRLLLNKLTFGLVQPTAMLLSQQHELSYQQVMRRADMTTLGFVTVAIALFWAIFGKTIATAMLP